MHSLAIYCLLYLLWLSSSSPEGYFQFIFQDSVQRLTPLESFAWQFCTASLIQTLALPQSPSFGTQLEYKILYILFVLAYFSDLPPCSKPNIHSVIKHWGVLSRSDICLYSFVICIQYNFRHQANGCIIILP